MKDIPVFTSEYGAASLVLREIPCRQEAYIRLQATLQPEQLLEECVSFCRACGAQKIYATGHTCLQSRPLHTAIVRMRCDKAVLPETDAALFPVLPETAQRWRTLYNEKMAMVPNASYMTQRDTEEMLQKGDGYFVHRAGELQGIGRAAGERIHVVISAKPGAGRDVVCALAGLLTEDTVSVEVASANERAVRLYGRLGFAAVKELGRWYRVR